MNVLLQIFSSFKKDVHGSVFRLVISMMLEAIIYPGYFSWIHGLLAAHILLIS